MEMPCTTSPLANGSLQAKDGEEIFVGKSAEDFADIILRLLNEPQMASELAKKGNEFVRNNYDWNATTDIVENAMSEVVASQEK